MASKTIKERVYTMVKEHLGVQDSKLKDEAHIINDLGADSLDHVELIMAAEEEFKVNIEDDDAMKVETLGDMVKLMERLEDAKP